MFKVRFTKVKNDHNRLRDDVIEGTCEVLPEVGKSFVMLAPPRDAGNGRMINTSPIQTCVVINGAYMVKTASGSLYKIEVL